MAIPILIGTLSAACTTKGIKPRAAGERTTCAIAFIFASFVFDTDWIATLWLRLPPGAAGRHRTRGNDRARRVPLRYPAVTTHVRVRRAPRNGGSSHGRATPGN